VLRRCRKAFVRPYNGFSFDNSLFLEATTGNPGGRTFLQAFVIDTGGNTTGTSPVAPEPGFVVLFLGIGVALIAISIRFWIRSIPVKSQSSVFYRSKGLIEMGRMFHTGLLDPS
jgi:hypothetical protein